MLKAARVIALLSVSVIILSIVTFVVETLPAVKQYQLETSYNYTAVKAVYVPTFDEPFFVMESLCIVWFSFELTVPSSLSSLLLLPCPEERGVPGALRVLPQPLPLLPRPPQPHRPHRHHALLRHPHHHAPRLLRGHPTRPSPSRERVREGVVRPRTR